MKFDEGLGYDWIDEVQHERETILVSSRNPIQILVDVFELCKDEFDITMVKEQQPELYQILKEFCSNVPKNDNELRENSRDLARFFYNHDRREIRKCDIQLYYAILNFIDYLKTQKMHLDLI